MTERKVRLDGDGGNKALVTMTQNDFREKVDPRIVESPEDLYMFQCPKCKGVHFRHAGYIETLIPFIRADKEKNVSQDALDVKVCVKCFHSYAWCNEQMYDVTSLIDIDAWVKAEKKLQKTTGPGGNC